MNVISVYGQESLTLEELQKVSDEGRLIVLPYSIGQTIYKPEYPIGSNVMLIVPVYLNSINQLLYIMFNTDNKYFKTYEECENYLRELYS